MREGDGAVGARGGGEVEGVLAAGAAEGEGGGARADFGGGDDDAGAFDEGVEVAGLDGSDGCGGEVAAEEELDGFAGEGLFDRDDAVVGVLAGVLGAVTVAIAILAVVPVPVLVQILPIDDGVESVGSGNLKGGHDQRWLSQNQIEQGRVVFPHVCQVHCDACLIVHGTLTGSGWSVGVGVVPAGAGFGVIAAVDVSGRSLMHSQQTIAVEVSLLLTVVA